MQRNGGLAVIPARGGSQRVPGKNIRPIAGMPALAHVITACIDSAAFDRIVVSTDDSDIADVAREAGAEVPFLRPAELSDNFTTVQPVIQHAVSELNVAHSTPVACVYATAVTVDATDIAAARARLSEDVSEAFIISVTEFDAPIQRALEMSHDGSVAFVDASAINTRSQDLPPRWHDAGQFIWGRGKTWMQAESVWDCAIGFPVPRWRTVDIDTEDDWRRAELLLALIQGPHADR